MKIQINDNTSRKCEAGTRSKNLGSNYFVFLGNVIISLLPAPDYGLSDDAALDKKLFVTRIQDNF